MIARDLAIAWSDWWRMQAALCRVWQLDVEARECVRLSDAWRAAGGMMR